MTTITKWRFEIGAWIVAAALVLCALYLMRS
jgi:hypothetical protein